MPAKVVNRLHKSLLAAVLLVVAQHSPIRAGAIKSEVNELPGKLTFVLLEFFDIRRQTKRPTRRVIGVIVFGAHCSNPWIKEVRRACLAVD